MNKKYIVELRDDEHFSLQKIVKKLKGTSQKVKRANILLKSDACGRAGPMPKLPRPWTATQKRWKTYGNDLSN